MKILLDVYNEILSVFPVVPPETGGIIGCGKNEIVSKFYFDYGCRCEMELQYVPNISILNNIISTWNTESVVFGGIIHSHFPGVERLSHEDENYIVEIMNTMPRCISKLYFPIVIPQNKIIPFVACRSADGIKIYEDELYIM